MKKTFIIISLVLSAGFCRAELSLAEAKANLDAAREAYKQARIAAGLPAVPTNRLQRRASAPAKASASMILSNEQAAFLNGRRIAVSRDTTTIPGSVITTWYRNGKPDWKMPSVETNVLKKIVGSEQNNPLQHIIANLTNSVAQIREQFLAASNRYEVAEARITNARAGLENKRAEYQDKYDKGTVITKPIYKAFIDIIDDILMKLDALMNKED